MIKNKERGIVQYDRKKYKWLVFLTLVLPLSIAPIANAYAQVPHSPATAAVTTTTSSSSLLDPKQILRVDIGADRISGTAPLLVRFNSTVAGGSGPYKYFWDFETNATMDSLVPNPVHTFKEPGLYNVSFGAVDSQGNYGIDSMFIRVTEKPSAAGGGNNTSGTTTATTNSNASTTTNTNTAVTTTPTPDTEPPPSPPPVTSTSTTSTTSPSPEEEEPEAETRPVSASDDEDTTTNNNRHDNDNEQSEPQPQPQPEPEPEPEPEPQPQPNPEPEPEPTPIPIAELEAAITLNNISAPAPATFHFDANVIGGVRPYHYSWDFNNDGIEDGVGESAVHTFPLPGIYDVSLIVVDTQLHDTTETIEVLVTDPNPNPNPNPNPEPCPDGRPRDASGNCPEPEPEPEPNPNPNPGVDEEGILMLYPTATGGPTWNIEEQRDPTSDGFFYLSFFRGTTFHYNNDGTWNVDATSGTQEHGIRMHVDSPTGEWKNTEMTGYFRAVSGSDQFTMIARHGPSYHDQNGCLAYGYYGMTAIDGQVFFKKKLYHFNNGYTRRLAQVDALKDLDDGRWIGMKFVVYDMPDGNVKLELWIDDGNETNKWIKVTEIIDKANLPVTGGDDCGRDATDQIDSGTRVTYRVDNMEFDFKKLSAREITPPLPSSSSSTGTG